mgnify:CR=1 FL=1
MRCANLDRLEFPLLSAALAIFTIYLPPFFTAAPSVALIAGNRASTTVITFVIAFAIALIACLKFLACAIAAFTRIIFFFWQISRKIEPFSDHRMIGKQLIYFWRIGVFGNIR